MTLIHTDIAHTVLIQNGISIVCRHKNILTQTTTTESEQANERARIKFARLNVDSVCILMILLPSEVLLPPWMHTNRSPALTRFFQMHTHIHNEHANIKNILTFLAMDHAKNTAKLPRYTPNTPRYTATLEMEHDESKRLFRLFFALSCV